MLAGRVLEAPGVDGVLADNADGGRQAATLLPRTGCRRLAYLGLGLAVPDEVAIIGFNNPPQASWRSVDLATLDYPIEPLVAHILALLDSRAAAPGRPSEVRGLAVSLVPRGTTRTIDIRESVKEGSHDPGLRTRMDDRLRSAFREDRSTRWRSFGRFTPSG